MKRNDELLSREEGELLLRIARRSIEDRLGGRRFSMPPELPPALLRAGACFVSLHRGRDLRGCIGSLESTEPLWRNAMSNAVRAAFSDPRFPPLAQDELARVDIEISVLTPAREIGDPAEFQVGRHGIILAKGGQRAVYLPQVAVQQGWGREETLDHLAGKAGLPKDAWRQPDARLQVFEARVFREIPERKGNAN